LNVETRSIAPDEVKRGSKFIEVRGPRMKGRLLLSTKLVQSRNSKHIV